MKLEGISASGRGHPQGLGAEPAVSLDQRVGASSTANTQASDAEFKRFYTGFKEWLATSDQFPANKVVGELRKYLKNQLGTDGERLYGSTQKQLSALQQVMTTMKTEGLATGLAEEAIYQQEPYKLLKKALVSVMSSDMFFKEMLNKVFIPDPDEKDEDDRANINW